jgi:alanine racemase
VSLVDVSLALGDEVTLFGISPTVCDLADCSQMIPYEILCNAGAHAKREYLG